MKGMVFTEFLELVEDKYGYDMVDNIISDSQLESNGAYTAIGTYPHSEMVQLVTNLSKRTGVPVPDLLRLYGRHIFGVFARSYGHFFEHATNSFSFLESIENYIHIEVKKLYPDAELPRFETERRNDNELRMVYYSSRGLYDFAYGLLEATLTHFKENGSIECTLLDPTGSSVEFLIRKTA